MGREDISFEEYVALARAGYAAFNRGEIEALLDVLDPGVTWQRREVHPVQGTYRGHAAVMSEVLAAIQDQFSELTLEPVEFSHHAGHIVVRIRQRGRGRTSGVSVEGELVHVLRTQEGLLKDLRAFSTMEEALSALATDGDPRPADAPDACAARRRGTGGHNQPNGDSMIGAIILGLVAGYIAKALMPGNDPGGFFVTIALGLVGSLIGFFLFTEVLGIGDDKMFDLGGLLGAIIGTMILLFGYRQVAERT